MKLARLESLGAPEIFRTIQGEGRNLGVPSVFIRTSLCNLHCRWCDTDYTWNWEGTPFSHDRDADPGYRKYRKEDQIVDLSPDKVAELACAFDCEHFVFTGGEPLLHEGDWVSVMDCLIERIAGSAHFEIETNGTRMPGEAFLNRISQLNVSPKLSNSGLRREQRIREDVLGALAETGKADFKFVVDTKADLKEVTELVSLANLPRDRIFLMPQGTSVKALDERAPWVATQCQDQGFRFSDRLHVRLFGSRRGV